MSRNDSLLNTGLSSAQSRRLAAKKAEAAKKKQSLSERLRPEASIILEWIEEEKAKVMSIEDLVMNMDSEENVRAQLLARKMHYDYLVNLGNSARIVLGRQEPKDE